MESPIRIVGWCPFPWPGEKQRMQRAEQSARAMVDALKVAEDLGHTAIESPQDNPQEGEL